VEERLPLLRSCVPGETLAGYDETLAGYDRSLAGYDLPSVVLHAHALKNTSSYIGASEAARMAYAIEAAADAGNQAAVRENLPGFMAYISELAKKADTALRHYEAEPSAAPESAFRAAHPLMRELAEALAAQRFESLSTIMRELKDLADRHRQDDKTMNVIERIADEVLMAEYGRALTIAEEFLSQP